MVRRCVWSRKTETSWLRRVRPTSGLSRQEKKLFNYGLIYFTYRRVQLKYDGTRWRTEREMKRKLTEWVASTLHTTSEHGVSTITTANAHTSAVSSRLNWRPRRFKCTHPFRLKTKSGFCACAITFQTQCTMRRENAIALWGYGFKCIIRYKIKVYWNNVL